MPRIRLRTSFACAPLGGCGLTIRATTCGCGTTALEVFVDGVFAGNLECGGTLRPRYDFGGVRVTVRDAGRDLSATVFTTADPHCCSEVFVECAEP